MFSLQPGGGLGGILGGIKNTFSKSKDLVDKVAESTKDIGKKVVEAGKDAIEIKKVLKEETRRDIIVYAYENCRTKREI